MKAQMTEPNTYKFSTFQEFFDRVPAERMLDCLSELAVVLAKSKQVVELMNRTASAATENDELVTTTITAKLPVLEWIDDGRGDLGARFINSEDQKPLLNMDLASDGTPTFSEPK